MLASTGQHEIFLRRIKRQRRKPMTRVFPKVGLGQQIIEKIAIQYVPELGGDLVMGLPIRSSSSLSCISCMHVRGSKILITGGATRRALGNSSVKLGGKKGRKSESESQTNFHRCGTRYATKNLVPSAGKRRQLRGTFRHASFTGRRLK